MRTWTNNKDGITVNVGTILDYLFEIESPLWFARCHYPLLYDPLPYGKRQSRVLTGTPGIGKSMSLLYPLIKRVQAGHPTCFHNYRKGKTWLFHNKTCQYWKPPAHYQIPFDLKSKFPEFTVLLDGMEKYPLRLPYTSGFSIMSSSPDRRNYSEWEKLHGSRCYMPLLSKNELLKSYCCDLFGG